MPRSRTQGRARRTRVATLAGIVTLAVLASSFVVGSVAFGATGENGEMQTFAQVNCTAVVRGQTLQQKQDIAVWAIGPNEVSPGETYTIRFVSIPADLPDKAQGITIQEYKNLQTKYRVSGGTVVPNSATNDGTATINGNPTTAVGVTSGNDIMLRIPGPIPPGHLVPPNSEVQVTATGPGPISLSAIEVTTTAVLQNLGDAVATCPIPANTLTTAQVVGEPVTTIPPTTGPSTTGGPTTTSPPPTGGGETLACTAAGALKIQKPAKTTGTLATKNATTTVKLTGTLSSCSGGPQTTPAITNGSFNITAKIKTLAGQLRPDCDYYRSNELTMKGKIKLQNGATKVFTPAVTITLPPLSGEQPLTGEATGIVRTTKPFKGKPATFGLESDFGQDDMTNACNGAGLGSIPFASASVLFVGPPPPPPTTTTTTTEPPTTTTTEAPTTTTVPETTTTQPPNPIPPEVQAIILTACDTLASAIGLFGADASMLTLACGLTVQGEGTLLIQLFLASPELGCLALAGVPLADNPVIAAGCVAFAAAIQPYSSMLAPLIPTNLFGPIPSL